MGGQQSAYRRVECELSACAEWHVGKVINIPGAKEALRVNSILHAQYAAAGQLIVVNGAWHWFVDGAYVTGQTAGHVFDIVMTVEGYTGGCCGAAGGAPDHAPSVADILVMNEPPHVVGAPGKPDGSTADHIRSVTQVAREDLTADNISQE